MKLRTLVILVCLGLGLYKGIYAVGNKVDSATGDGGSRDALGVSKDVTLGLALVYRDRASTVSKSQFDSLSGGMINLSGSVTNNGPAARSIQVLVKYQDKNFGAPERSEVVDLGAFDHGETRQFDDLFTNTLGSTSRDGRTKNYSLDYTISLETVVPR